jgi:Do/DeqQ family serine protease
MEEHRSGFNKLALILISFFAGAALLYLYLNLFGNVSILQRKGNSGAKPPYFVNGTSANVSDVSQKVAEITNTRNNVIVQAAHKVGPSVISISTVQIERIRDPWLDWYEPFFPFRRDLERKNYGLGSGFIIDKRGYIITNQHVIEGADSIKITLADGKELESKIVGADYETDLAVLKVDANSDLSFAELGDSSDLLVGEWAIAIGSPFGFLLKDSQPTVTVGVISATGRSIRQEGRIFNDLIQTDASVNPGNSGGPLVNSYGQVIGINTAIFSTSGGSQGIGFAIPINTAKGIINDLIEHGEVVELWIGVEYQELNKSIAEHLNSPVSEGLLISDIVEDSPAEKAGLTRGDVVVKIGDQRVRKLGDADKAMQSLKEDQTVVFQVIRDGEFRDIPVKAQIAETVDTARTWFGLIVQEPTLGTSRKYGLSSYKRGVLITHVDRNSSADRAELKPGDLILIMAKEQRGFFGNFNYEEKEIRDIDDFRKFVSGIRKGQIIKIIFQRKGEMWRTYLTAEKS